jgi:hypothetical protein
LIKADKTTRIALRDAVLIERQSFGPLEFVLPWSLVLGYWVFHHSMAFGGGSPLVFSAQVFEICSPLGYR